MRVQILEDKIVAWGVAVEGEGTYEAPDDYSPEIYEYTPAIPGVFDPNGFTLKQQENGN